MNKNNNTKEQLIRELEELRLKLDTYKKADVRHKKAKKKLLESEKKYRGLFENATDGIYLIDSETQKILDCNPKASSMTGYRITELKAMSVGDLHPIEEQDVVTQIFKKVTSAGSLTGISDINQRKKDGTLIPVEINAATLEIDKNNYCLAIIRDITERKRAVLELKKSEEQYRSLFKHMFIGCALQKIVVDSKGRPTDYVFLEINDAFERLTGLKRANVIGRKVTEIIPDFKKEEPDLISIFGNVALKGEVAKFELKFKPFNKWYSVSAYSPMKGYFVSLFDDISHRKYWDEKIRESEEKYRALFESAYDSIFIIDPETRHILDANENAAKRLGYLRNKLLGLTIDDIDIPMAADRKKEVIKELNEKGSITFEHAHRRKDGSVFPVEINSRIIGYGDRKVIESLVRDITKRKKAEEALRESEKRFRDISENALEWIWEVDRHGRYTYSGPLVEKILGYKPEEMLGKYFYDFFHPDDRDKLKKSAVDVFSVKQPFREFINRNIHKNGSIVWLSTSGIPIVDRKGTLLGYRGADTDITVWKEAEDRLIRADDEWKKTFDTIPDLILITDNNHRIVKVNKAMAAKLGRKQEDLMGRSCYELIHDTRQPPSYCPHGKTLEDGKEHVQEMHEDKLKGHFLVSASPVYDSHHKPLGVVEVARDITERKKMEEKLQEAAITDELTGLFNRRGFHTFANQQLKLAKRKRQMVSLVYLDLDNMKTINDECGHHEGDNALIDVAHILKNTFRESDIIARIGGDEFAILLLDPASPEIDDVIIKNVQSMVRKFNELRNRNYTLCLSIGVAHYNPARPCSIDELITQADILMYQDKKQKCDKDMLKPSRDKRHEKRSYQRYKTGDNYWATLDGSGRIRIKDVSLGGICLKTSHNFTADTLHKVSIISTDNEEIKSSGKVVRSFLIESKSEKGKDSAYFETALKFDEKNYPFIKTLEMFISRFAS